MVEHLTFNQVVRGSNPRCFIRIAEILSEGFRCFIFFIDFQFHMRNADMAELADALVLGTSGHPVQVQVLLSAGKKKYRLCGTFFVIRNLSMAGFIGQSSFGLV